MAAGYAVEPSPRPPAGNVRCDCGRTSSPSLECRYTFETAKRDKHEMAHDPKELRERAPQVPFPPYPARPPHTHDWVGGRCACGFRLLRSGMMVMYPSPHVSCGCECHYATDGGEPPLAEFRVKYLSRVTAQSGHALRDLCRGCYREMRHADRVAHFVNW
jgi:hypothetical protein